MFLSFTVDSVVLDGKDDGLSFSINAVVWTSSVLLLERPAQLGKSRELYLCRSLSV